MKKYPLYLVFLLAACSKNNDHPKDTAVPFIILASPTANEVFNAGATVSVNGTITDNTRISEVHVHVYNNTTGALLMDIHRNPSDANYVLNESFTAQTGIQYKIQVIAKDNSANESLVTVYISTN